MYADAGESSWEAPWFGATALVCDTEALDAGVLVGDPYPPEFGRTRRNIPSAIGAGGELWSPLGGPPLPPSPSFSSQLAEWPAGRRSNTSVIMEGLSAPEIMSCVQEFLMRQAGASIQKINHCKPSIKAVVFLDVAQCLLQCTFKLRVFQAAPRVGKTPHIMVELDLYQGDAVAFGHLFESLSAHLKLHDSTGAPESGVLAAAAPPLPTPPWPSGRMAAVDGSDVQPLVDMCADGACPAAQLESITGLLVAAEAHAATAFHISAAIAGHHDIW
eukprot:CAMPEP_0179235366 /NCGR_PEP_ID=MMETSP0797-20121207/13373_1 /TAXON_ID=47934 /ORGANISM="Dinophysis acuminata, Strain DAEP01" /LENGTH=272 /DNA_ID=CAMNT_0020942585 /DNA_START=93 /DNA_END=908 /DNA_ORIENTATION=+